MFTWIKILIFVVSLIILTSATPFLKTLLTTSTPVSHISDFRNLRRSDSRADKPDIFPGFDFLDEPTTVRIKSPLDLYAKFIGRIVRQGRQGYEQIVNNLQQYEINRRANLQVPTLQKLFHTPRNAKIVETVPSTTAFDELTLDYENQSETLQPPKQQNWVKKYFSSLAASTGLEKLRNATDPEYINKLWKTQASAIGTYINPLNIWKAASKQLQFERNTVEQQNQNKNSTDSETEMNISTVSDVSNSLPLPFRNAFLKYSNSLVKDRLNDYRNNDENETMSDESSGVPLGDVNFSNNANVDFPIERIDKQNDAGTEGGDDDDDGDEGDDDEDDGAGNVGIFILEIFGTIAGLTWGAFSQIQSLFAQNEKQE